MKAKPLVSSGKPLLVVEVKLKVRNLGALRKQLAALGCHEEVARSFEDNWTWDFPGQELRRNGKLLRVRQFAGHCSLTFKGPAGRSRLFKIREESETEVRDFTELSCILERLGMVVSFRYQKFRTSYSLALPGGRQSVNVLLDETPIGNYLEIEGPARAIEAVAAKLGYKKEDFINESYVGLFFKSALRKRRNFMTFTESDHEENPWVV